MTSLAVAALSARMLAESACAGGFEVVALDLFGDTDTRNACSQWQPIGRPGALHIDASLFLSALADVARRGDAVGWIAGSGFEGRPELLEQGAALLPLIGTPADAVRRVRDPQTFFDVLDAHGLPHPAVRMVEPADPEGWLFKDSHGCGGWHIRRASTKRVDTQPHRALAHQYFQREVQGTPMSATFIANGSDARVLGFNRLTVRRFGARPFVFCGAVGPVPMDHGLALRITAAVRDLSTALALRGVCSLDFMLDDDSFQVLEINPRPPASMALYGECTPTGARQGESCKIINGVVAAHVRACLHGELPPYRAPEAIDLADHAVRGTEVVFAAAPLRLDESGARRLAAQAGRHDLPAAATYFETGDPLCSISASGANAEHVLALLAKGRKAVYQSLEMSP